jgi:hypothetical protein
VVTITSSSLGVVWPTVNGNQATNYNIAAGTGATTSISGATTTISVNLNNGSTQTCSANQFLNSITSAGIVNCGSITFPTPATYTFSAGTGISLSQATSSSNTTTTINNTGVTSFTGQGCVTAANTTGSVSLAVSCITGNQTITFILSGDATGTASGATSITDAVTVVGLNGKALPANTTGTLQYSQGAWAINLATSSLGVYDANGKLSSYLGSSCGGGQYVTGFSATGTVACGTPPTGLTYSVAAGTGLSTSVATSSSNSTTTVTLNINNGSVQNCTAGQDVNQLSATGIISCSISVKTLAGVNTSTISVLGAGGSSVATTTNSITITSVSTSTANTWTVLQTFTGLTVNGTTTLASTTNALLLTNGSGIVSGYAGSNCSANNAPTGISATGTVQNCTAYLTGNQSVTLTISGDATGTASGATSISDSIQVTGLLGKALPSLATGTLEYTGGAWTLAPITSASTYSFSAGTGLSVSQATSTSNTTTTYTNTGVTSFNTATGTVTYTNNAGTGLSVTTSTTSSTYTLNINGGSVQTCTGGQLANSLSATGTITCQIAVQTLAGVNTSTITINGTANEITIATTTNSITLSTPQAIGTGSSPTFSNLTITNNVTSTSFVASTTATSSIANLNGTFNIPANYATAGCPWKTSDTDLGACVMDAYESVSSTASSSPTINIPILPPFTTYSTFINFNNNNEWATLNCAVGQILLFNGTLNATSGGVTYNEGQSTAANVKISHTGGNNCHIALNASPNTNATGTAIYIGGTNGEAGLVLNNMGGIYAGVGLKEASNTYMATTNNFTSDENVQDYVVATGSNSGETLANYSFHALDTASTTLLKTCVQTMTNAFTELAFYSPSFDDCGITIGPTSGSLTISAFNGENPAALSNLNYPAYPLLTLSSSSALTVNITGGTIALDAESATSSPTSTIVDNANLTLNNIAVDRNGNQTVTNLVDISGNQAAAQITTSGLTFQASAVTNMVSSTAQAYPTSSSLTINGVPVVPSTNYTTYSLQGPTTSGSGNICNGALCGGGITIPFASTITGLSWYNGSLASGSFIGMMFNASGTLVAHIATTTQSGTFAGQSAAFTAPYYALPGEYWLGIESNSPSSTMAQINQFGYGFVSSSAYIVPNSIPISTIQFRGAYVPALGTY